MTPVGDPVLKLAVATQRMQTETIGAFLDLIDRSALAREKKLEWRSRLWSIDVTSKSAAEEIERIQSALRDLGVFGKKRSDSEKLKEERHKMETCKAMCL